MAQVLQLARLRHLHRHEPPAARIAHPLTKEDILEVRRVYADLDEDGGTKLKEVLQDGFSGKIPNASYIVNTSPDRYQLIWNVKPGSFTPQQAEALMRGLAIKYGGDRAVTDVSRVLRLPGFKHRGKNTWITMSSTSAKMSTRRRLAGKALFVEPRSRRRFRLA